MFYVKCTLGIEYQTVFEGLQQTQREKVERIRPRRQSSPLAPALCIGPSLSTHNMASMRARKPEKGETQALQDFFTACENGNLTDMQAAYEKRTSCPF